MPLNLQYNLITDNFAFHIYEDVFGLCTVLLKVSFKLTSLASKIGNLIKYTNGRNILI